MKSDWDTTLNVGLPLAIGILLTVGFLFTIANTETTHRIGGNGPYVIDIAEDSHDLR